MATAYRTSPASWLRPAAIKLVEGEKCPHGHPVEDLVCADCGSIRYRGATCEHVAQPPVIRRKWDGRPLCMACLRGSYR